RRVWREHVGAGVALVVGAFGIDERKYSARARQPERLGARGLRQHALAVVGENQHLGLIENATELSQESRALRGRDVARLLVVDAHDLLVLRNDPLLDHRAPLWTANQSSILAEQLEQLVAFGVSANQG